MGAFKKADCFLNLGFREIKIRIAVTEGRACQAQKRGGYPHLHATATPRNGELQYGCIRAGLSIQSYGKSSNESRNTLSPRSVADHRYSNRVNRWPSYGIESIDSRKN